MNLSENIKNSLLNIKNHLLRTMLTLLGITIGVFAVISLSSSVYIVKTTIKEGMKNLGWDNTITVYASTQSTRRIYFRRHFGRRLKRFMYMHRKSSPLTLKDFYDIKNNVPNKFCYATVSEYGEFEYKNKHTRLYVTATNYDYLKKNKYKVVKGRFFYEIEINKHLRVCLLTVAAAKELIKKPYQLIGKTIKYNNKIFRVIGIVDKKKYNNKLFRFYSPEEAKTVFIPLTTGIYYYRKSNTVDNISIQANSQDDYEILKVKVRQILLRNHNMAHDFQFFDIGSMMLKINNEINSFMKKWSILLITIASISLLVGGIGLFSTLIISITERMNEIGIRKSIGAKNSDIFLLFISEALILSLLAAFFGFTLSYILVKIVSHIIKYSYSLPLQGILIGFAFSIIIGFLSGLYPALKASKINPIEAIYYYQ